MMKQIARVTLLLAASALLLTLVGCDSGAPKNVDPASEKARMESKYGAPKSQSPSGPVGNNQAPKGAPNGP